MPRPQQEQPEFTGPQSYYNSGIIPYEGQQGNEYRVKLADDIEPGRTGSTATSTVSFSRRR